MKYLVYSSIGFSIVAIIEFQEIYFRSQLNEVVFYDISRNTLIDFRYGFTSTLFHGENTLEEGNLKFVVQPDRSSSGLEYKNIDLHSFEEWASPEEDMQLKVWNGIRFLRLSGDGWMDFEMTKTIGVDYLILSNNSVKDIREVQNKFLFKKLILDSSNSIFYSRKLKDQSQELGIVVHSTLLDGATTVVI